MRNEEDVIDELLDLFGDDVEDFVAETSSSRHVDTYVLRLTLVGISFHKIKIVVQYTDSNEDSCPTLRMFITPREHLLTPAVAEATYKDLGVACEALKRYLPVVISFCKDRGFIMPRYELPSDATSAFYNV